MQKTDQMTRQSCVQGIKQVLTLQKDKSAMLAVFRDAIGTMAYTRHQRRCERMFRDTRMHVLLVEDNALVASGVKAGLQLQGFGVDVVGCAAQADAAIKSSHFDVCVLDLGLPDEDGLHLLARWRKQGVEVPVLVLTARDAVGQRIEGLQTGADDYLVKPFDLHELAARLHALLRRAAGRSVDWIVLGDVQVDLAAGRALRDARLVDLSRREWALLRALLQSPGRVLNMEQLRDSLYGYSQDVESNAVNVHVHHLRRKLGSDIVETVRGVGFRLGRSQDQEAQ